MDLLYLIYKVEEIKNYIPSNFNYLYTSTFSKNNLFNNFIFKVKKKVRSYLKKYVYIAIGQSLNMYFLKSKF